LGEVVEEGCWSEWLVTIKIERLVIKSTDLYEECINLRYL